MPNMKGMGPACCCCNNIYTGTPDTLLIYRHKISSENVVQFDGLGWEFREGWRNYDFDPVHKKIFASFRQPTMDTPRERVVMLDEDFTNEVVLAVVGGSQQPRNITTDSDGERLFYLVGDTVPAATRTLYTVNHDGTGNTSLGNITATEALDTYQPLHYCRANGKIYYVSTDTTHRKLFRINDDGSGDTLIADKAQANGRIFDCTIDNVNGVLWWIEQTGTLGQMNQIWKSDLNGSGATLVYSAAPIAAGTVEGIYGVQWSHKKERLYWWKFNASLGTSGADPTRGLFSFKGDGSDVRLDVPKKTGNWPWGTIPIEWRLSCGYETLGAGSPA